MKHLLQLICFTGLSSFAFGQCENFTHSVGSGNTAPDGCTGYISLYPSGGSGPYTYSWGGGLMPTGTTAYNVCAGTYSFIIADAIGCQTGGNVTIAVNPDLSTAFQTQLIVIDDSTSSCTGGATIYASGGTAPYTYEWSTGESTYVMINQCPGTYSVTTFDAAGDSTYNLFAITDVGSTYEDLPYLDSVLLGNLDAGMVEDCSIDYNSIDSAALYQAILDSANQAVIIYWAIYSPTDTVYVTDTLNFSGQNGVYGVSIVLYCPEKSDYRLVKILSQIYIGPGTASLGTEEQALNDALVYPNPFGDRFTISLKEKAAYTVSLTDGLGRTVFHSEFPHTDLISVQPQTTLPQGTYLLKIESASGTKVLKMIR